MSATSVWDAIAPPLDWGQKNQRDLKHTHLQAPFCMTECAKTHLQQSRISKFSGGGEGREGRRGRGKGREGGRGRDRGGREGGEE